MTIKLLMLQRVENARQESHRNIPQFVVKKSAHRPAKPLAIHRKSSIAVGAVASPRKRGF